MAVMVKGLTSERLTHHGPHFRYDNVPMELRPLQQPHPGFWYGALSPDNAIYAARRGMNIVSIGGLDSVKRVTAAYREHHHESAGSPLNVNPHLARPITGAIRHIYVADTDREAEQVATRVLSRLLRQPPEALARLQYLGARLSDRVRPLPSRRRELQRVGRLGARPGRAVLRGIGMRLPGAGVCVGQPDRCTDAPLLRSLREPDHAGFRQAPGRRIAPVARPRWRRHRFSFPQGVGVAASPLTRWLC